MSRDPGSLPGFKIICTSVGVLYVLLGCFTLAQGSQAILAPFGLPAGVLASPHFADFFHWVFVHMITIGMLIGMLGRFVIDPQRQRTTARVLCLLELHYLFLDVRTSVLGNNLYPHPKSLAPVIIDLIVVVCFAYLSFRPISYASRTPS